MLMVFRNLWKQNKVDRSWPQLKVSEEDPLVDKVWRDEEVNPGDEHKGRRTKKVFISRYWTACFDV